MSKRKKRSVFTFLRRIFLGLAALLLLLYLLLHTPYAQDRIAADISRRLSQNGMTVELKGLGGFWPFRLRLQEMTVDDGDGIWLTAKNISVTWQLRKKEIRIRKLSVDQLELLEIPVFPENSVQHPESKNPLEDFDWNVDLSNMTVESLTVAPNISGKEITGSLQTGMLFSAHEFLQLKKFLFTSEDFHLSARGKYVPTDGTFRGKLSADLGNQHTAKVELGFAEQSYSVKGELSSPDPLNLFLRLEPYLSPLGFDTKPLYAYLPGIPAEPFPLQLKTNLHYKDNDLISDTTLAFSGGELHASGHRETDVRKCDLTLEATVHDPAPAAGLFRQSLAGEIKGNATMQFQQGLQSFSGEISGKDLRYNQQSLKNIQADVSLTDEGWHITSTAERGGEGQTQTAGVDFTFLSLPEGWKVSVKQFSAAIPPLKIGNAQPVVLQKTKGAFKIPSTEIHLNGVPLQVEGKGTPEDVDFLVRVAEYDAEQIPEFFGLSLMGNLAGNFRIQGKWNEPTAELDLAFKDLAFLIEEMDVRTVLGGELSGRWSQGGLEIKGQLRDNQQNHFDLQFSSPATWSLQPLKVPGPDADFSARLRGSIDLSLINYFTWFSNQRVSGQLKSNFEISIVGGTPHLKGSVHLEEGVYDHYRLGTHVDQITVEITLKDHTVKLARASGRTPGNGTLTANGTWEANEFPGSGKLHLDLSHARILHLDPVQAGLSGKLSLTRKPGEKMELGGKLVLEETTFHMDRLPKPVPKPVPFKMKGESEEVTESKPVPTPANRNPDLKVNGEISLDIPSSLIVQGKNLYSTWEGGFRIFLRKNGLHLDGKLIPKRGTVNFFGRAFKLNKGTVHFNDVLGSSPVLDLEAGYSRDGLDAVLLITGRADDPKFRLRSNPPLPEDEILSRILFGKELATITGLQALEVGLALKSMMDSEGRSNWDLMGKARNFLGVDQLELRESGDAEGSTEIVAGRQINHRIYLEFNQNLKEPGSSILLEYEILRNLSISTETGTHTLPGIGVNWKRDY